MGQIFINELQGSFKLRQPKSEKPTGIYFVIRLDGKQYKFSTGAKVYSKQWDERGQVARTNFRQSSLDNHNNAFANKRIMLICSYFEQYKDYICKHPEEASRGVELLRMFIYIDRQIMPKRESKTTLTATSTLKKLLRESDMKDSSKDQTNRNLDKFQRFLDDKKIKNTFDNINLSTLNLYQEYLIAEGVKPVTIKNITKGSIFPLLKKASKNLDIPFSWASSNLDSFEIVRDKSNKELKENKQVALTEEQVELLYKHKLTEDELSLHVKNKITSERVSIWNDVKDLFVFQCYTGQRKSDLAKFFNGECTYNEDTATVSIIQQKTNTRATIPLLPTTRELLERFKGKDISFYLQNKANDMIKIICKICGFTEPVKYQENSVDKIEPFCNLVHTHSARHTFITICVRKGIPKDSIILATGHLDTVMIDKVYEHLNSEDKAKKVQRDFVNLGLKSDDRYKIIHPKSDVHGYASDLLKRIAEIDNMSAKLLSERINLMNELKRLGYFIKKEQINIIALYIVKEMRRKASDRDIIQGLKRKFGLRGYN